MLHFFCYPQANSWVQQDCADRLGIQPDHQALKGGKSPTLLKTGQTSVVSPSLHYSCAFQPRVGMVPKPQPKSSSFERSLQN